jgi:hypothetical protein
MKVKTILHVFLTVVLAFIIGLMVNQARDVLASSITANPGKTIYQARGTNAVQMLRYTLTMDSGGTTTQNIPVTVTGKILYAKTNPGTTAPTDNYDLSLISDGVDIMGGALGNRDTANTEWAVPLCGSLMYSPYLRDATVQVKAENNLVTNATVVLELYVEGY